MNKKDLKENSSKVKEVDDALNDLFLEGSPASGEGLTEASRVVEHIPAGLDEIDLIGNDEIEDLDLQLDGDNEEAMSEEAQDFGEIELSVEDETLDDDEEVIEESSGELDFSEEDGEEIEELDLSSDGGSNDELDLGSGDELDFGDTSGLEELDGLEAAVADESLNEEDIFAESSFEESDKNDLNVNEQTANNVFSLLNSEPESDEKENSFSDTGVEIGNLLEDNDVNVDKTSEFQLSQIDESEELSDNEPGNLSYSDLPDSDVEISTSPKLNEESEFLDSTNPDFEFTSATILRDPSMLKEEQEETKLNHIELSEDAKKKLEEIDQMINNVNADSAGPIAEEIVDSSLEYHLSDSDETLINQTIPTDIEIIEPVIEKKEDYSSDISKDYQDVKEHYQLELQKMATTLSELREDRDQLERQIQEYQTRDNTQERSTISLKAELDDSHIQNQLLESKYSKLFEELKSQVEILSDKKSYLELKNKQLETELEEANRQQKVDVNKIRKRERELEEMLNLLKEDTQVQLRNRDHKILDLKRKIDTLEFDIESAQRKEKKIVDNKRELEDKMNNLISTLRDALGNAGPNTSLKSRSESIKKILDV